MKKMDCVETMEKKYEPFNDVWYQNCFFHGLAQIAYNYGFLPNLFENDYFNYSFEYKDSLPVISFDILQFNPWHTVFEKNGVSVSWVESDNSLLDEICRRLDAGEDIMLPVDSFYENIREDAFGKFHLFHYFVIYGYDNEKKELLLLEHNYENDLNYKKTRISFASALTAHKAYPKIHDIDKAHFLVFKKNDMSIVKKPDKPDMHKGLSSFFESIHALEKFIAEFDKVKNAFSNEDKRLSTVDYYRHVFGMVFSSKKYQSYFCQNVFDICEVSGLEDFSGIENCNNWGILMGILARCKFTRKIPDDLFERLQHILQKIIAREKEYKTVYEGLYGKCT